MSHRQCKKCGHIRSENEHCPEYQCPNCGAIYAKVEAALARGIPVRTVDGCKNESSSEPDPSFQEEPLVPDGGVHVEGTPPKGKARRSDRPETDKRIGSAPIAPSATSVAAVFGIVVIVIFIGPMVWHMATSKHGSEFKNPITGKEYVWYGIGDEGKARRRRADDVWVDTVTQTEDAGVSEGEAKRIADEKAIAAINGAAWERYKEEQRSGQTDLDRSDLDSKYPGATGQCDNSDYLRAVPPKYRWTNDNPIGSPCHAAVAKVRRLDNHPDYDCDASIRRSWSQAVEYASGLGCKL